MFCDPEVYKKYLLYQIWSWHVCKNRVNHFLQSGGEEIEKEA